MSEHQHVADQEQDQKDREDREQNGPVLSESGSAAQNPETSQGGADSVPDTPDVNTQISDTVDVNEQGGEGDPQNPHVGR